MQSRSRMISGWLSPLARRWRTVWVSVLMLGPTAAADLVLLDSPLTVAVSDGRPRSRIVSNTILATALPFEGPHEIDSPLGYASNTTTYQFLSTGPAATFGIRPQQLADISAGGSSESSSHGSIRFHITSPYEFAFDGAHTIFGEGLIGLTLNLFGDPDDRSAYHGVYYDSSQHGSSTGLMTLLPGGLAYDNSQFFLGPSGYRLPPGSYSLSYGMSIVSTSGTVAPAGSGILFMNLTAIPETSQVSMIILAGTLGLAAWMLRSMDRRRTDRCPEQTTIPPFQL